MLKIRLKRVGRKHDPSFRIVVTEKHRGPKSGKYIESVGFYDARRDIREVDAERIKHWIGVGAQVSDTVHNILVTEKVIDGKKINVLPKKSPVSKDIGADENADKSLSDETQINADDSVSVEEAPVEEATTEETPAPEPEAAPESATKEEEVSKESPDTARDDSEESKEPTT